MRATAHAHARTHTRCAGAAARRGECDPRAPAVVRQARAHRGARVGRRLLVSVRAYERAGDEREVAPKQQVRPVHK